MKLMNEKSMKILSVCLLCFLGSSVSAEELIENVVVRNRLYTVGGRHELGFNYGLTMMPRLTNHNQFNLNYAYNFGENLALEFRGGYALTNQTALYRDVTQKFEAKNSAVTTVNDFRDMWVMNGNASLGVRWAPIYGKISLIGELPVHFQGYFWLGGGAAQFNRTSVLYCVRGTANSCSEYRKEEPKVAPLVSAAIGGRFFLSSRHSLRLEVRDYSYLDSYRVNIVRATAKAGGETGTETANPGFTHLVQFDIGYNFIF